MDRDDGFDSAGLPTSRAHLEDYFERHAAPRGWTRPQFQGLCSQYARRGLSAPGLWRRIKAEVEDRR